jgi:hypothetical protein
MGGGTGSIRRGQTDGDDGLGALRPLGIQRYQHGGETARHRCIVYCLVKQDYTLFLSEFGSLSM